MKRRALLLSLLSFVMLASCKETKTNTSGNPSLAGSGSSDTATVVSHHDYNLTLTTKKGKVVSDASITLTDADGNRNTESTDEEGLAVFYDFPVGEYTIAVTLPDGYDNWLLSETTLKLTDDKTDISLVLDPKISEMSSAALTESDMVMQSDGNSYAYVKGSQVHDFSFTDVSSDTETTYTLKGLLEKYDVVVFDFFYKNCSYCNLEYPVIKQALNSNYTKEGDTDVYYSEKVCFVGFDTLVPDYTDSDWTYIGNMYYNNATYKSQIASAMGVDASTLTVDQIVTYIKSRYETVDDIKSVKTNYSLPYSLCKDAAVGKANTTITLSDAFGITGTPTTVAIDRYGYVANIDVGYVSDATIFTNMFDSLLGKNYVPSFIA